MNTGRIEQPLRTNASPFVIFTRVIDDFFQQSFFGVTRNTWFGGKKWAADHVSLYGGAEVRVTRFRTADVQDYE